MNGQAYYDQAQTMLQGFGMESTMFYTFLNTARIRREMMRPFQKFKKLNTSLTVPTSNTYTSTYNLPSDFLRLARTGTLLLFDGQQTWQVYSEIPMELQIQYKDVSNVFFIDHANSQIHICGIVDRQYTIYLFYQADLGNITSSTQWLNIPTGFQPILLYDVVAMYELGVDYDDIAARNANANAEIADLLFEGMKKWDEELALSAVQNLDYPVLGDAPDFISRKIPIERM